MVFAFERHPRSWPWTRRSRTCGSLSTDQLDGGRAGYVNRLTSCSGKALISPPPAIRVEADEYRSKDPQGMWSGVAEMAAAFVRHMTPAVHHDDDLRGGPPASYRALPITSSR